MFYRSEIDGLRALAVMPIILFPVQICSFAGGFVGVDVFFLISGYLITNIIWKDCREGRFSIPRFYERRVQRILPPLSVVVAACVIVSWFFMMPSEFEAFGKNVVSVMFLVSKFLFWWAENDYSGHAAEVMPLLHT